MHLDAISHIPSDPGIYFFKDKKGSILYIGKAKNLHKRVAQYFSPNSVWKQDMLSKADNLDFLIVKNESEALYLEDNLIKKNKPEFNNLLKADNSYAYIKITPKLRGDYPQIFLTRKKFNDGSTYIGPKHNTIHLKKFLQYLRQILQFRGCKNTQFAKGKVCSDYYFGLCKGWCTMSPGAKAKGLKAIDSSLHSEGQSQIKQYQKIIGLIESFFKGNTLPIQHEITSQIEMVVKKQNFEWAAKLRDIYVHIDSLAEQQTVVIQKPITGYLSKIKKIGTSRLYCVCNFYEGKLIDVIRGKESTAEMDEDELKASIEREFFPHIGVDRDAINRVSIGKSDRKELHALMEKFFDSYIISTSFEGENLNNDLLTQLQERYHLHKFPYRIECIDISHLSGGRISGGLSCLTEGLKNPKGYRRYKIQHKEVDDYAALEEVIQRRFSLKSKVQSQKSKDLMTFDVGRSTDWPDLLLLDGGKGQLGIIKKIKNLDGLDVISLGKGKARKKSNIGKKPSKDYSLRTKDSVNNNLVSEKIYFFDSKGTIQSQSMVYDQADKLLLKARDEAHRFANAYRKKQMSKEFKTLRG